MNRRAALKTSLAGLALLAIGKLPLSIQSTKPVSKLAAKLNPAWVNAEYELGYIWSPSAYAGEWSWINEKTYPLGLGDVVPKRYQLIDGKYVEIQPYERTTQTPT